MYEYQETGDGYSGSPTYVTLREKEGGGDVSPRRSRSRDGCMRFVLLLCLAFMTAAILVAAAVAILVSRSSQRDDAKTDDIRLNLDQKPADLTVSVIQFVRQSTTPASSPSTLNLDDLRPPDVPESRGIRKRLANAKSRGVARGKVIAPSGKATHGRSKAARPGAHPHDYWAHRHSEKKSQDFDAYPLSKNAVLNFPLQPIDSKLKYAPAQSANAAIENLNASPSPLVQGDLKQSKETNLSHENNAAKSFPLSNAAVVSQEEKE